jgi:CDP-diacylglycerol---serine O-phosphatidyltransferase
MWGSRVAPSVMTLGGLFLAFWSMTLAHEGHIDAAVWAIFAAACADLVDGGIARALGTITPFGQQLDSLVDLVAAGVAPAFLLYQVYFADWGVWGVAVAFVWVAMVAARLARFNTSAPGDARFFVGVPCPIAATVVVQYVVFSRATWGTNGSPWVSAAMIAVIGGLMVSHVPYWKSSTLLPGAFHHYAYGPGVAATLLLTIPFPDQAIFVGTATSVVAAVVIDVVRPRRSAHVSGVIDSSASRYVSR